MRIALVSPYDPFPGGGRDGRVGGVERVFAEVATRLAGRGHDVTVVCSSEDQGPGSEPANLDVRRLPRLGTLMRAPVASLAPAVPDAEVVHVAGTYPFTTPAVLRRAHRRKQAAVLDFHFEPDPVSHVGRAAASTYRLIGPRAYTHADTVLVRSLAYARNAPSLRSIPPERLRVVPNGIDPKRFSTQGPRHAGDYILFVGRLVPYKGLRVLVRALSQLPDAPPLVIAGDGPLRDVLQLQAQRLGVDARFLGNVADEELPSLYRGARLTALPSIGRQECFGIALLESMACGTPVIASALPGVDEVASRGGLTVPPDDPTALAQTLQVALTQDVLPRGARLANAIHAEFSWATITDLLLGVYRETLDGALLRRPTAEVRPFASLQ